MQSMQPMKQQAMGNMLQKRKPLKQKISPTPKTMGNPRSTQPVVTPQAQQFSPQPVLNEQASYQTAYEQQPQMQTAVMPGAELVDNGMMQPQMARQDAMQRMMMMRAKKVKQTPLNKFKRIGVPTQPVQQEQQAMEQNLYMQRMMQQMQIQQQGRYQF